MIYKVAQSRKFELVSFNTLFKLELYKYIIKNDEKELRETIVAIWVALPQKLINLFVWSQGKEWMGKAFRCSGSTQIQTNSLGERRKFFEGLSD